MKAAVSVTRNETQPRCCFLLTVSSAPGPLLFLLFGTSLGRQLVFQPGSRKTTTKNWFIGQPNTSHKDRLIDKLMIVFFMSSQLYRLGVT